MRSKLIDNAVEMCEITKKFGNFTANDKINLKVKRGEVHAILGENGAGKSTLMNILYGLYEPTSGEILINGEKKKIQSPNDAIKNKIGMVHQHFMLVKPFTIAENIILGCEEKNKFGMLDIKKAEKKISEISEKYGLFVKPEEKVQNITVGMEQRVEILKTLYRNAEILIFDEPTAVLTPHEIQELGKIMKNLVEEGKSIIFITHKLKEIKHLADRCTIIRKGKYIDTINVAEVTTKELASKMVGREVSFEIKKKKIGEQKKILSLKNLQVLDNKGLLAVNNFSIEVKTGEIFAIAGIDGNGQTELVEALTGLRKVKSGEIFLNDKDITNNNPGEIFMKGIAHIPEDRQKHGLVLDFSIKENLILQNHVESRFSNKGIINFNEVNENATNLVDRFDIRPTDIEKKARDLSGGNQQKVIIAREVTHDPQVLIAVQPTRGLDVGAIEFVHHSLIQQRDNEKAVLLVSLELDEVLKLADRIAVIYEGEMVGILDSKDAEREKIGLMMAGGFKNDSEEVENE